VVFRAVSIAVRVSLDTLEAMMRRARSRLERSLVRVRRDKQKESVLSVLSLLEVRVMSSNARWALLMSVDALL
jgi:hypothetical protein